MAVELTARTTAVMKPRVGPTILHLHGFWSVNWSIRAGGKVIDLCELTCTALNTDDGKREESTVCHCDHVLCELSEMWKVSCNVRSGKREKS